MRFYLGYPNKLGLTQLVLNGVWQLSNYKSVATCVCDEYKVSLSWRKPESIVVIPKRFSFEVNNNIKLYIFSIQL